MWYGSLPQQATRSTYVDWYQEWEIFGQKCLSFRKMKSVAGKKGGSSNTNNLWKEIWTIPRSRGSKDVFFMEDL